MDYSKFQDFIPSEEDLASLTYAEFQAFQMLVDFHIKPGIAFKQILPDISGSETQGFEDYFVASALDFFRDSSYNQQSNTIAAATFVSWWTKLRLFDTTSDVWAKIIERVVEERKALKKKNSVAYDNRLYAKDMTQAEFKKWWNDQRGIDENQPKLFKEDEKNQTGFDTIEDVINKYQLDGVDFV